MTPRSLAVSARPPRTRIGQLGFTMVELLIVMAVSLTGLVGLMSVYMAMAGANESMGQSAEAIDVCEKTMEGFRSMAVSEIEALAEYGPITPLGWGPVGHHKGDVIGRNGIIFSVDVAAQETAASAGLVRIRVEVSWSDDGKGPDTASPDSLHSVSLEMIRTRAEAL